MGGGTTSRSERGLHVLLLVAVVIGASAWTLGFPRTPESWSQLSLLRERSLLGAALPFEEYPYYRPLWFLWLSLSDRLGLGGGLSHIGPLTMHALGCVCVYGALRRLGSRAAFYAALLVGVAPGCASALSWLAAGNKAFVFGSLAIGVYILARKRGWVAYPLAIVCGALPAIGSSENGYVACVLYPFVVLVLRSGVDESTRSRYFGAAVTGLASLGVAVLHLFVLSPQRSAGADDRLGQLLSAWTNEPLQTAMSVADNFGRFFAHGVGVADDAPRLGLLLLALLVIAAIWLRSRALGLAIAVFVILNVPASCFPGESSRHQAYLPAIGAGLVVACLFQRLPGRAFTLVLASLFFIGRGFEVQRPWSDYCQHSARVFASSVEVLPEMPLRAPLLVNVPEEYRAAFHLRFGEAAGVARWPVATMLSSRSEVLLPADWQAPKVARDALVIEYDGQRLVRSSFAAIAARKRAPLAWWATDVQRLERPWLGWGEMLRVAERLTGTARGFDEGPRESVEDLDTLSARAMRVLDHGMIPGQVALYWNLDVEDGPAGWLVLGWTPWNALPTTENAWLFTLAPLPWAFEARVLERRADGVGDPIKSEVHPVYGFLPALWCETGARRLRVELRIRGR